MTIDILFLQFVCFFFFKHTATTEIYTTTDTLSLHDALPILGELGAHVGNRGVGQRHRQQRSEEHTSELQSPVVISYAVFCLKKKKITNKYNYIHFINKIKIDKHTIQST